jgi:hypothetical protein
MGNELIEIPVSKKTKWKDWVDRHPKTLILSVDGIEGIRQNPYDHYFQSREGFRNQSATDNRMRTKEPVYAFAYHGKRYATPLEEFVNGRVFTFEDGSYLFIHRRKGAELFESTTAFISKGRGFERRDGKWFAIDSGALFDENAGDFTGGTDKRLNGFDTFWYNWSLNNPDTEVLQ